MAETTTAAAPIAASRSRPAPPTCAGDDQQHADKAGGQRRSDAPVEPLAEQRGAEQGGQDRGDEAQRDGVGKRQPRQREEEGGGRDHDQHGADAVVEHGLVRGPAGPAPGRVDERRR